MWHSPTDRSAFVGAVGFRITRQETQEKPWPASHSAHWAIGLQILDLTWPMNQLQLLSAMDWEPPGNTALDNHRWQSACGGPSFQQRGSSTALKKKKSMSGHMGEGKWNSWLYRHNPFPRQQRLGPGEPLSAATPPTVGGDGWCREKEHVSEHLASPAMQDATKEAPFPLTQTEYWILRGKTGGSREWWRERQIRPSEGMNGKQILCLCHRFLQIARSQGPGDNLPQKPPSGPQSPPACPTPHTSPIHAPPHGQLPCMLTTRWASCESELSQIQTDKIRNGRGDITTNTTVMWGIITDEYE